MKSVRTISLAITLSIWSGYVASENIQGNPQNYVDKISSLNAGDNLILDSGIYTDGIAIRELHGSEKNPITIAGPEEGAPAIFLANSSSNTVHISDSSYVSLRHLTLDGLGLGRPTGIDSRGVTHNIKIENLNIVGYSGDQGTVAISTKGPAWNWTIRNNIIVGAGTGMYLGNSDGNEPFIAGLIERNYVVDTIGYNIQIKHQNRRPEIARIPSQSNKTVIRHNVFSKKNNSSSGDRSRPNLLVGHQPKSGNGAEDVYEIYGNVFYQNPDDALFQGEGNIDFYYNLLLNEAGSGIVIRPHNHVPKTIRILNNAIFTSGVGIDITGADPDYLQVVFGNGVFASIPTIGVNQGGNIVGEYALTGFSLIDLFNVAARLNKFTSQLRCLNCLPSRQ